MKQELSALDIHYLVKDMQELVGARLDKIYQKGKEVFFFVFYVSGKGKRILKLDLPRLIYFVNRKSNVPQVPKGFCAFLRKYLDNVRVRGVSQKGFDRVLEFSFEKKDKYILIIELFSKGNLILCKDDYTILSPLNGIDWAKRNIRKGLKYEFPPAREIVFDMKIARFKELIKDSNKENIVKTLAIDLGLGGAYAEEVCYGVLDKTKKKVSDDEIKRLFKVFKGILVKKSSPVVYGGKKAFPFELKSFDDEGKKFDDFSSALSSVLFRVLVPFKNKVDDIIEKQEDNVVKLEKQVKENAEIGELIYNNYKVIDDILKQIKLAREKYSWKELKEKLKGHKVIKSINEGEGTIVVDVK